MILLVVKYMIEASYYAYLITSIIDLSNILTIWSHRGHHANAQKWKSSDPVVKIHQHYLNISKTFRLFRKSSIGVYGPDIEILVSKFTTFESTRISISGPKTIEITKVYRPNLLKYIRKNCQILRSN